MKLRMSSYKVQSNEVRWINDDLEEIGRRVTYLNVISIHEVPNIGNWASSCWGDLGNWINLFITCSSDKQRYQMEDPIDKCGADTTGVHLAFSQLISQDSNAVIYYWYWNRI